MNPKGFTLIEVVVAVTILAFLSIMSAQSIQRSIRQKAKIQQELDARSEINSAIRLIERDINLAFNYRDITTQLNKEIEEERKKAEQAAANGGQPPGNNDSSNFGGSNTEEPPPPPLTKFIGDGESIFLTSLNNIRVLRDIKESDQLEVGYYLDSCDRFFHLKEKGKCLWRHTSTVIDEDLTKGGSDKVLLEAVKEFKLRYFGIGKEDWTESWKSDEGGDALTQKNFPHAVEITITTERKQKTYSLTTVATLRFPNNPPKVDDNATPTNN